MIDAPYWRISHSTNGGESNRESEGLGGIDGRNDDRGTDSDTERLRENSEDTPKIYFNRGDHPTIIERETFESERFRKEVGDTKATDSDGNPRCYFMARELLFPSVQNKLIPKKTGVDQIESEAKMYGMEITEYMRAYAKNKLPPRPQTEQ